MATYGFIVMAWLIFNLDDRAQHVPFATMEACQTARVTALEVGYWSKGSIYCVASGARKVEKGPD